MVRNIFVFTLIFSGITQSLATDGYGWLAGRQNGDGSFSASGDIAQTYQGTAQAVLAFGLANQVGFNHNGALDFLAALEEEHTETLSRALMNDVFTREGRAIENLLAIIQNDNGGFGDLPGYHSTPFDTAWALRALNHLGNITDQTEQALFFLIDSRNRDGAWGLEPDLSSPYVTALVAQAMAPHALRIPQVAAALSGAQTYLVSRKGNDDLWGEDFVSAIVLDALMHISSDSASLGPSIQALAQRQQSNGSWDDDVFTTALALQALQRFSLGSGPGQTSGSVTGLVLRSGSGEPIGDARISLLEYPEHSVYSNGAGHFLMTGVHAGPQTLVLEKQGYAGVVHGVTVPAAGLLNAGQIILASVPHTARLKGRIFDDATRSGVEDARVAISGPGGHETFTDRDGRFEILAIQPGSYHLSISALGYATVENQFSAAAGDTVIADQGLLASGTVLDDSPASVFGRVIDGNSRQPIQGATFSISGNVATTDSQGRFQVPEIARGSYGASLSATGYLSRTYTFGFPAGSSGDMGVLSLFPQTGSTAPTSISLTATIRNGIDGNPVSGVTVSALNRSGLTSANGSVTLSGLSATSFTLNLSAAGYQSISYPLQASGYGAVAVGLDIYPEVNTGSLSVLNGTVRDESNGLAIAGATLELLSSGQNALTQTNGAYQLADIAELELTVRVSADGYNTRQQEMALPQHGNYQLDLDLTPQTTGGFQVVSVNAPNTPADADSLALVQASITNLEPVSKTALLIAQIRSADDQLIAEVTPYAPGTQVTVSEFAFGPGETLDVTIPWNTHQTPAGGYTIRLYVAEPGTISQLSPTGNILAVGNDTMGVASSLSFRGGIDFDPPMAQAGAVTPIGLKAVLRNTGNDSLPAGTYILMLTDPLTGGPILQETLEVEALGLNGTIDLDFGQWTAQQGGEFGVVIARADDPSIGSIVDTFYVGDLASGTFSLDRYTVPEGTQTVAANISLTGVDTTSGTATDPLFDLVRESIENGAVYTGLEAQSWHQKNRCLGCHVQSQTQLGLAASLDKAEIDRGQALYQYNTLASSIQADGGLYNTEFNSRVSQTQLGAWSLSEWPDAAVSFRTGLKAVELLYENRDESGDQTWFAPDNGRGWWYFNEASTAITVKAMAGLLADAQTLDPAETPDYIAGLALPLGNAYNKPRGMVAHDGYLYIVKAEGAVEKLDVVTGESQMIQGPTASTRGSGLNIAQDGTLYIAAFAGLMIKVEPDGTVTKWRHAYQELTGVAITPDGGCYAVESAYSRILRFEADGTSSVFAVGGLLNHPYGVTWGDNGNLLVTNAGGYNILRITPTGEMSVFAEGFASQPLEMTPRSDGAWYVTTRADAKLNLTTPSALNLLRADGTIERLFEGKNLVGLASLDGVVYVASEEENNVRPMQIETLDRSSLNNYPAQLQRAANFFLASYTKNEGEILFSAFRLIGLAEVRPYTDAATREQVDVAMQYLENLIRTQQLNDGGWPRFRVLPRSDPFTTAWAGIALDTTNPPKDDPQTRAAVQFLLNTQLGDGSWGNVRGYMTTRLAATSLVMAYLPKALERLGGLDVALDVAFPTNVSMSNPDLPPQSQQTGANGDTTYHWNLAGVTSQGLEIKFQLTAEDMDLNEVRGVATRADLTFQNSFSDEMLTRPVQIPEINALSQLSLQVTTDKPSYSVDEDVLIQVQISNAGPTFSNGRLALFLRTPVAEITVAEISISALAPLNSNSVQYLSEVWHTARTLAGDYQVYARLLDPADRNLAENSSPIHIIFDDGSGADPKLTLHSDQSIYGAWDRVVISGRVFNRALNGIQAPGLAELTVQDPFGNMLLQETYVVGQLTPGALTDFLESLELIDAAAGAYAMSFTLYDADGQTQLAHVEADFQVERTSLQSVTGEVSLSAAQVMRGDWVTRNDFIRNISATVPLDTWVVRRLVQIDTETVIDEVTEVLSLSANAEQSLEQTFATAELEVGLYACTLSVAENGEEGILASALFEVLEPPIRIDAAASLGNRGRLLILADSEESNPPGWGDDDPFGPAQAPLLSTQKAYLNDLLIRNGWSHTITDNETDFLSECHSGSYAAYLIFSEHIQLAQDTLHELREAVFRGEHLWLAGIHDHRLNHLDSPLGVTLAGQVSGATSLVLAADGIYDAAQLHLTFAESVLPAGLDGSLSSAVFTDGSGAALAGEAITARLFGEGRAIYMGFDAIAQATSQGTESELEDLLTETLDWLFQGSRTSRPGLAVPLSVDLSNQGIAVDTRVVLDPFTGGTAIDRRGFELQTDGTYAMLFQLGEGEMRTVSLLAQLPLVCPPETQTFATAIRVQIPIADDWVDHEVLSHETTVLPMPVMADTVALLRDLEDQYGGHYKNARKEAEKAADRIAAGDAGGARDRLLKAASFMEKIGSLTTQGENARRLIGEHLREAGMGLPCN